MADSSLRAQGFTLACCLVVATGAHAATEKVVHSFQGQGGSDGAYPDAGLINVGGTLFGTTTSGGVNCRTGCGTVYSVDPGTGTETVLYSFCSQSNCADGGGPEDDLIDVKGTLYGTASIYGRSEYAGTLFRLDPATGAVTVLYSFCSQSHCTDGMEPIGGLIRVKDKLYGTTLVGGANGGDGLDGGTVFAFNLKTGTERVLYSFCSQSNCADGEWPYGNLLEVNGTLYGTTFQAGANGFGTVFSLTRKGIETVLHSFQGGSDGGYPDAGLIDVGGTLYGTTHGYLTGSGDGTVYSVTSAGVYSVLYAFQGGSDGAYPVGGLIDVNGTLYGTTRGGGASGDGTVFSVTPAGVETVLYSFQGGSDGANPEGSLIDVHGALYGTTYGGGAYGEGTVFKIKP